MSIKARIRRPTTATPRTLRLERFVHVSTDYQWLTFHPGMPAKFVKVGKGTTYRRAQP